MSGLLKVHRGKEYYGDVWIGPKTAYFIKARTTAACCLSDTIEKSAGKPLFAEFAISPITPGSEG
jgi:hypothetical protein